MAHFVDFVLPGPRPAVSFDGPVAVEIRACANMGELSLARLASSVVMDLDTFGVCLVDKVVKLSLARSPEPGDLWVRIIATKEVA